MMSNIFWAYLVLIYFKLIYNCRHVQIVQDTTQIMTKKVICVFLRDRHMQLYGQSLFAYYVFIFILPDLYMAPLSELVIYALMQLLLDKPLKLRCEL